MSALENYPRVTPFLWFDSNAEEAVNFYLSVFKNSRIIDQMRIPGDQQKDKVLTIAFEIEGLKFTALNGGPMFKFNESVSFVVRCDSQEEIDYYWAKFTAERRREPVWLVERQVRTLLADRTWTHRRTVVASQGNAGLDGNEEDQHRRVGAGGEALKQWSVISCRLSVKAG